MSKGATVRTSAHSAWCSDCSEQPSASRIGVFSVA